jgi:hypothetical protein
MHTRPRIGKIVSSLIAVAVLLVGGCGQAPNKAADKGGKTESPKEGKTPQPESGHNFKGRDWCGEHGVPESVCSMCGASAEFKKKGDWCDKHDRGLSQCFVCKPELKAKFAAEYKAKYGEAPPPTE